MVIDSSAFVAILENEAESRPFRDAIEADATRLASAATVLETAIVVLVRRGEAGLSAFQAFNEKAGVETVPFGAEQTALAISAFHRFGKGRHPAGLNFGDCFAYALTKATGEPLLFKGDDFSHTDVTRAKSPSARSA